LAGNRKTGTQGAIKRAKQTEKKQTESSNKVKNKNKRSTAMMNSNAAVKVRTKNSEKVNVATEVNKVAVGTLAVAAGIVGAWVITAFVAGMLASGGLVPMISNWIQAVIG
jgi:hypothetical protein